MNEATEVRKPGRPPKQESSIGMKKGKASWKPASITEVSDKDPGYRYRWVNKNPDNLAKKEQEGWEPVSKLSSDKASYVDPDRIQDGKQLTSTYEKHDCILQRLPEDIAKERDAYMNRESARRVGGLTAHLKKDMAKDGVNAPIHGDITISSRKGTQVID